MDIKLNGDLKISKNAKTVLARRYLKKDADGKPTETPAEMILRVASTLAEADLL